MRMTYPATGLVAVLAVAVWASGCGGNVVVDPGAGGSGPGSTGPGPGGTTTTTTGTGVNPSTQCQQVCQLVTQLGCAAGPVGECISGCVDLFAIAPQCNPELGGYLDCLLAQLTDCEVPPVCINAFDKYQQCANQTVCDQADCFVANDGSCGCKGFCQGLDVFVECSPQAGSLSCGCFVNGTQVGVCQDFSGTCSIETNCCSQFFFNFDD